MTTGITTMGQPNQDVFASTLMELARQDASILVVTSDSRGSGKLEPFGQALPGQIVEVGIAEQNLVGISAGLASTGKKVFTVSPACFLTTRALEQIKNDVCYSDRPVKLIGISAGVSYGALGSTHHSLHDYATLRCINNITIVAPADNLEAREAVRAVVNYPHPVYLRFGKKALPHLHPPGTPFEIGRAITIRDGDDVTFIATGETVARAAAAADILDGEGIASRVISMHTVRPFDREAVLDAARHTRALITVEEHSVYGGLGEACAAALMQAGLWLPFKIAGIPDEYTITGSQSEILDYYGLSGEGLARTARQMLQVPVKL